MRYPHYVRIRRTTGSTVDRDTGDVTLAYETLYEGPADVQDEGAIISRRVQTSEEVRASEATIFVPRRADISAVQPEDVVDIMWVAYAPEDPDDLTQWGDDAEVVRAIVLDNKLFVKAL